MAKSDSDSNGLRQDQPECASQREAGRRETHNEVCCYRIKLGTPISYRSGVTELPGLTSDPIFTADRRGGILISFGPERRPYRVINPSSWPRFPVRCGRELDPRPNRACIPSERPFVLKGIGSNRRRFDRFRVDLQPTFRWSTSKCVRGSTGAIPHRVCIPTECPFPLKGIGSNLRWFGPRRVVLRLHSIRVPIYT